MARKSSLSLSLSIAISLIGIGIVASAGAFSSNNADLPHATAAGENVSTGGSLDGKRIQARDDALASFKFTNTNLPKWSGNETACYNASTKTFTVDSPEDFAYAVHNAPSYAGATINILADLDMNGQGGKNFINRGQWVGIHLKGNNHKIYNFYSSTEYSAGLCTSFATDGTVENITFISPRLDAKSGLASLFNQLMVTQEGDLVKFTNVHVENGLFNAGNGGCAAAIWGNTHAYVGDTYSSNGSKVPRAIATNCGTTNCTSIGYDHIGGTFGLYDLASFKECYAQGDTIIAFGGHSGCLASCSNKYNTFENCWSNSTIYGNTTVGGFTSGCEGEGAYYKNCFSSGVVEGNEAIGGFVGQTGVYGNETRYPHAKGRTIYFENCYTTAMVGMNYEGTNLGGFAGEACNASFTNCYAAGEVGSIDTDVEKVTTIGGFVGRDKYNHSFPEYAAYRNSTFSNCYYDMQTTAMKNRAVGSTGLLAMTRDSNGVSTVSYNGVKGLTTKKITGASNIFSSGYAYTSGLYPQLAVMTSHSNALFRAQSAASAATVFCDDWADLGSAATGFDTVRDTVRAYSFSSVDAFTANPDFEPAHVISPDIVGITWKTDANVSSIDKTSPVVELSTSPYYSLSQSPGVEWAQVSLTYKSGASTSTGNRRLRLIPTSTITGGNDKRIDTIYDGAGNNNTELYNHNTDFNATYCDATTLLSFLKDNVAHSNAIVSFNQASNLKTSGNTITGDLALAFNDKTRTLPISIDFVPRDDTGSNNISRLLDKLSGISPFEAVDRGFYELRYKISLPDGRHLSASKNLLITQQYVISYLYNYTGLLNGNNITDASIYAYKDALTDYVNFDYTSPYGGIAPVRDGYTFAYWSFDEDGMKPVSQVWFDTFGDTYGKVDKNLELYAQWNRNGEDYTLVIDPKQGTYNSDSAPTQVNGVAGNKVLISSAIPAPDARSAFVDWQVSQDDAGTFTNATSGQDILWVYVFGEGDGYISAQYVRNIFEVKWLDDTDGTLIATELVAANTPAHAPHHPPKHIGRVFSGFDHMKWECVDEDMEVRLLYTPYIYEIPYDTDSLVNQCIIDYPEPA